MRRDSSRWISTALPSSTATCGGPGLRVGREGARPPVRRLYGAGLRRAARAGARVSAARPVSLRRTRGQSRSRACEQAGGALAGVGRAGAGVRRAGSPAGAGAGALRRPGAVQDRFAGQGGPHPGQAREPRSGSASVTRDTRIPRSTWRRSPPRSFKRRRRPSPERAIRAKPAGEWADLDAEVVRGRNAGALRRRDDGIAASPNASTWRTACAFTPSTGWTGRASASSSGRKRASAAE